MIGAPNALPADVRAKLTACFDTIGKDPTLLTVTEERKLPPLPMTAGEAGPSADRETVRLQKLWDTDPWL